MTGGGWRVTPSVSSSLGSLSFDRDNCVGQTSDDSIQHCHSLQNRFGSEEEAATFVTTPDFSRYASRNFQVLWQLLVEAPPVAFLNVGTDRIKAAHLLLHQFTPAVVLAQNLGVGPKRIEQLAGELINSKIV